MFDMTELQLKQVREVFCKARESSVPRPSSTADRVYKNCPKLVLQLWMILHVSGEGEISQKSGEWVTDYHCAQPGKCIWLHRTQASAAHTEETSCPPTTESETTSPITTATSGWGSLRDGITSSRHCVEVGITIGRTISAKLFSLAMDMLIQSAKPECKEPRTTSAQRQPPIRAFIDS